MNITDNKKINTFFADIESVSKEKFEMVVSIRTLFLQANDNLIEDIKYGGLAFSMSEGLIGGIYVYKEHISIEFSHGANFSDPHSVLDGGGKKRRHLKIYSNDDITLKKSDYFIKQAVSH